MKTYNQLSVSEKELVNSILDEAYDLVKENAVGTEFVRINMYEDSIKELKEKGETELQICGAHFFSSHQWDDIDKDNQVEIFNFEQDLMEWVEGEGEWTDCDAGQNWLQEANSQLTQNIINYLYND